MKTLLLLTSILVLYSTVNYSQTSPPSLPTGRSHTESNRISTFNDTITFNPDTSGTIINTQYLNKGVVFSGFNGSTDPIIHDYSIDSLPYGRVLHSDNWYNALRMNFVDTLNSNQYHLAKTIEFDNVVDSAIMHNGEIDFMSIDVYDSLNVLIYHYLSTSPEHIFINLAIPSIAYITIDDSAGTAFVIDNILIDFGNATSVNELLPNIFRIYPNPFSNNLNISVDENEPSEITLYDNTSRNLLQQQFVKSISLNTEQLAKGLYFYEVIDRNGSRKKGKVVKY